MAGERRARRDRGGPTATSRYGVSRRERHDASGFYARFEAPVVSDDDDVHPDKVLDEIFCGDARSMPEVPDRSVALVVTSPPYFAGKEYEAALGEGHVPGTYVEYLAMLEAVFAECVRTLEPGGRLAVNVANLGRRPYRSLAADVVGILQDRLRLLLRGEVVWVKGRGATGSCAWGSFQRPTNPVLRDLTERIIVASKGRFDRALPARTRQRLGLPWEGSLSRDEFMEATTDVWEIPPERATRVGHPAPFPVELPERLIHLYTYRGDLVLDPFVGVGTTAVAALRTGRHYAGYDTDPGYVEVARERIRREQLHLRRAGATTPSCPVPTGGAPGGGDAARDPVERALRAGRAAREVARTLVEESGFRVVTVDARPAPDVEVALEARDRSGRRWLFDVAGGYTIVRPGLRRAATLWKALGKAAVLHELEPDLPFVLLTAELPNGAGTAQRLLAAVTGPGKPVLAVLALQDPRHRRRLRAFATLGPQADGDPA